MSDLTNYDGRLEQMALYCEALLDNLAKLNNAYQDVSNNAYSVSLPSDMIKFKGIKKVGGKTIVWNQLVNTGTTTVSTISGRKYYTLIDGTASIITGDGSAVSVVDDTADMVCDLTLMFGSGNEPSTLADFTAIFGATHYSYNAGELLSAGVTKVISKDANNATLQTYSIPAEIQALEGYGWSAGGVSNYIDFERKAFVKNVGKVVLDGTQDIAYPNYKPLSYSVAWLYNKNAANPPQKEAPNNNTKSNVVASKLITRTFNECENYNGNFISAMNPDFYSFIVRYMDTSLTTTEAINAFLSANPITVYYELLNPIEIDISEYLTDDILIQVVSGGTLTFENKNGDDYKIPVPVELEYIGVS